MSRELTFRQMLNCNFLNEGDLGRIYLLGAMLLRHEGRSPSSHDQEQAIKDEILKMKPEDLFTELENDIASSPEKFAGPGPDRVRALISEARAAINQEKIREGKNR
jgi:hypothetical protein